MGKIADLLATRDNCEAMGLKAAVFGDIKAYENPFNAFLDHERFSSWRNGFFILGDIDDLADREITEAQCELESAVAAANAEFSQNKSNIQSRRDNKIEEILSLIGG